MYEVLTAIYFLIVLLLSINLLMSGERPTKTLAWLLVLIFIPVAGILFYITFGVNRRHFKFNRLSSAKSLKAHLEKADEFFRDLADEYTEAVSEDERARHLERIIVESSGFKATNGNLVEVLQDGENTFNAIFDAIESAEQFIHVQYYIYEAGELADRFAKLFAEKRALGVEVRLMYDGVGSMNLDKKYLKKLRAIGVETQSYFPLYISKFLNWQINYRNHRKIVVVDGRIGFTGGINVSDKYIREDAELGKWSDHHVRIAGPAVWSLNTVFTTDWYFASRNEDILDKKYFPVPQRAGPSIAQVVSSGPDSRFPSIQHQYLTMIHSAKEYIYFINPYVIPDEPILSALKLAALGGIDVRILLPEKSDSVLVNWSMKSYFKELLECGVQIIVYLPTFLHSKLCVSDNQYLSIGTANLDIRSFYQNYEVNLVIYDSIIAHQAKKQFLEICRSARNLDLEEFSDQPFLERFKLRTGRILSPLM